MFQFLQYRKFHLYLNYFHDYYLQYHHVNIDFYTKRVINQKSYPILNNYIYHNLINLSHDLFSCFEYLH